MAKKTEQQWVDRDDLGGVLLIDLGTLRPGTMDDIRAAGMSPAVHVPTREEGLATLRREGYRFRLALVGVSGQENPEDDSFFEELDISFPWIGSSVWRQGSDTLTTSFVMSLLTSIGVPNNSPPFAAAVQMQPLREAGPLLFSLALTEQPWLLDADAIVVPISPLGDLGSMGTDMNLSIGGSPTLADMAKSAATAAVFSESIPIRTDLPAPSEAPGTKTVIFATTGGTSEMPATVGRAVRACLAAISTAADIDSIVTLVLPLVGTGAASLSASQVLRQLLADFDPRTELGTLSHVIVVVPDEELYEELAAIGAADSLILAQQLENDLPRGEDQLNVKSDIDALADSMAMRDLTPPLVVGILGGWGTGKSFALHLLKERLRRIRCWDLTEEKVRESFPFVGHIYLVHFDAWTYAKSDLWASLMHKILADLNRQLAIEEAGSELLMRGLDIWSLLEDLSSPELEALETEIGARALESLRGFEPAGKIADSLRTALQSERKAERARLQATEHALDTERRNYARDRQRLTKQIESLKASAESAADRQVAAQTGVLRGQAAAARADLEAAERRIRNEDAAKLEKEIREAAWRESRHRLGKALYSGINEKLPQAAEAPAAIVSLFDEVWTWKATFSKLTPQHWLYLVAALAAVPLVYWLIDRFAASEVWPVLGTIAAAVTSIATSIKSSATSLREKLVAEQVRYDEAMDKRRAELAKTQAAATEARIATGTRQLRETAEQLDAKLAAEQAKIREQTREKRATRLEDLRARREALDRNAADKIRELETRAEEQERLVGLNLEAPSLYEVIKERVDAENYDEHLGIVHRVQEDLKQVSDALMPADRPNIRTFPRGEPRIVLIIDDLDRCPPKEVIQVLEAAQLLVKTRLFVVVIGMDVRYVARSLEEFYKGVLIPDGTPSGLDYIEKIVQIPYRVPDISPTAMRPFLERQVKIEIDAPPDGNDIFPEELEPEQKDEAPVPGGPVFKSSVSADEYEQLLPEKVQIFSSSEVDVLHECCAAAEVSPRSAKRLVNVFKLMKIIWFHRGPNHEPDIFVKRGMLILMTLSARQPVIMREILRDLDGLLRRGLEVRKPLGELLRERLMLYRNGDNARTIDYLMAVVAPTKPPLFVPEEVTLHSIGAENLRLVRSFSFVGETVDEIDASPPENPATPGTEKKSSARKGKAKRRTKRSS